jgi:hypothetical protein
MTEAKGEIRYNQLFCGRLLLESRKEVTVVIRATQLNEMASAREESFVRRMVQHVNRDVLHKYEAQGLRRDEVEHFVRSQIAAARTYGLINARDLKVYIDCAVVFGENFDSDPRFPWASAALTRQDLDGSHKADRLHDYLIFAS